MTTETKAAEISPELACCDPVTVVEAPEAGERVARMASGFKALSDETRLRIMGSLLRSNGPLCECEIVPAFGLSQSTISYHLKVLREAGLVEADRRGVWAYYRVNPRALLGVVKELAELA